MAFDDKKHPRDTGKFTVIPGGKDAQPGAKPGAKPPPTNVLDQAKRDMMTGAAGGMPQPVRTPQSLGQLGQHASSGYRAVGQAIEAMHAGDIGVLHHHGRALQASIQQLRGAGAKPEEIEKLRRGLGKLHAGLVTGDKATAHEALTMLQHGFYHAHDAFTKEGGGAVPPIGPSLRDRAVGMVDKAEAGIKSGAKKLWQGAKDAAGKVFEGAGEKLGMGPTKPAWKSMEEFKAFVDWARPDGVAVTFKEEAPAQDPDIVAKLKESVVGMLKEGSLEGKA